MSSNRAYIVRALYEWITDNHLTPHLLVNAQAEAVDVPVQAVQNGKVILNIHPDAVQSLELGNEWITFETRFAGVQQHISLPVSAVIAVYARENGQGMMFAEENDSGTVDTGDKADNPAKSSGNGQTGQLARAPHLKIIK